jgi:hypothetical protein
MSWARLLKRVFDIDIEHCPQSGGRLKIIAAIEDPPVDSRARRFTGVWDDAPRPGTTPRSRAVSVVRDAVLLDAVLLDAAGDADPGGRRCGDRAARTGRDQLRCDGPASSTRAAYQPARGRAGVRHPVRTLGGVRSLDVAANAAVAPRIPHACQVRAWSMAEAACDRRRVEGTGCPRPRNGTRRSATRRFLRLSSRAPGLRGRVRA